MKGEGKRRRGEGRRGEGRRSHLSHPTFQLVLTPLDIGPAYALHRVREITVLVVCTQVEMLNWITSS